MVKVWATKTWEKRVREYKRLLVFGTKPVKSHWDDEFWPPARLVIMTKEEYEAIIQRTPV